MRQNRWPLHILWQTVHKSYLLDSERTANQIETKPPQNVQFQFSIPFEVRKYHIEFIVF